MTLNLLTPALLAVLALPAAAADPVAGEAIFKTCKACHSVVAPDGTEVMKGGRTGPNLWGVVGRAVAVEPDFRYGAAILAAGATGAVWDEAALAAYVADPQAWLASVTGDSAAASKMRFQLDQGGADVAAWLALQR